MIPRGQQLSGWPLVALVVAFCLLPICQAAEQIDDFHTTIQLRSDGMLEVTETIAVHAEGALIDHGIYRDLPKFVTAGTHTHYDRVSARRNNQPEAYTIANENDGIRIYVGDAQRQLPPGNHRYQLTYRIGPAVSSMSQDRQLTLPLTGDQWGMPIAHASAEFILPASSGQAPPSFRVILASKSTEQEVASELQDGRILVDYPQPLAAGYGLFLELVLPPATPSPQPTTEVPLSWLWLLLLPALLMLGYLLYQRLVAQRRVG